MVKQNHHQTVSAIVAAYNEGSRLGSVLATLVAYPAFKEIIVIDDGSTDNTAAVACQFNIRYVKNEVNRGKGFSLERGVELASSEVIFFCDADISGLTAAMIADIIRPVVTGHVDMSIAMRNRKLYFAHHVTALVPLLGGERAVTRTLWKKIPAYYKDRFKIEAALNFYALYYGNGFQYRVYKGLSQVIKEKKYGWQIGLRHRWEMLKNIVQVQIKLHTIHIPSSHKNSRRLAIVAVQSLLGIGLALLLFVAAYYGPANFAHLLTAHELREDPSAPVATTVVYLSEITSKGTAFVIGLLLLIPNVLLFFFTFKNLTYWLPGLIYKVKSNKSDKGSC